MYRETARAENLNEQELEHLVELMETRAYEVLVDLQERYVGRVADVTLQQSDDLREIRRAQGMRKALRTMDGIMSRIYNSAKLERKQQEEKEDE